MESGQRTEAGGCAEEPAGPVFTLEEVGKRNSNREAWLVIHGRVYDVTRFLEEVRPCGAGSGGPGRGKGRGGGVGGSRSWGGGLELWGAPGPSVFRDCPGEDEEKEGGGPGPPETPALYRSRRGPRSDPSGCGPTPARRLPEPCESGLEGPQASFVVT